MTTPTFAQYTATLRTLAEIADLGNRLLGAPKDVPRRPPIDAYGRAVWLACASELDGPWRDLARSVATGRYMVRR